MFKQFKKTSGRNFVVAYVDYKGTGSLNEHKGPVMIGFNVDALTKFATIEDVYGGIKPGAVVNGFLRTLPFAHKREFSNVLNLLRCRCDYIIDLPSFAETIGECYRLIDSYIYRDGFLGEVIRYVERTPDIKLIDDPQDAMSRDLRVQLHAFTIIVRLFAPVFGHLMYLGEKRARERHFEARHLVFEPMIGIMDTHYPEVGDHLRGIIRDKCNIARKTIAEGAELINTFRYPLMDAELADWRGSRLIGHIQASVSNSINSR